MEGVGGVVVVDLASAVLQVNGVGGGVFGVLMLICVPPPSFLSNPPPKPPPIWLFLGSKMAPGPRRRPWLMQPPKPLPPRRRPGPPQTFPPPPLSLLFPSPPPLFPSFIPIPFP